MLPLFSLSEASALDKRLIPQYGLDEAKLIDSAASLVFQCALGHIEGKRVTFLVGKGNNGSDALEVARLALPVAASVRVVLLDEEKGNSENLRRRALLPEKVYSESIGEADTIVDGLFGFGFHGDVEGRARELILEANGSGAYIVAIDAPSAFLLEADETVALTTLKTDFYHPRKRAGVGRISLFNPGFPVNEIRNDGTVFLLEAKDYDASSLKLSDYKNTRGHLLVAGGSDKYPGAPVLTSLAAFHAGAGLVTLQSVDSVREKTFSSYPSIMTIGRDCRDYSSYAALAAGPGWNEGDRKGLEAMASSGKPMVLDADALKLLSGLKLGRKAVITPHLGEYRRLKEILGINDPDLQKEIRMVAMALECVVVLKSSVVWITDGKTIFIYDGANPSLGMAGSGDTLTGIIGALLASGEAPLDAARNGVILHQKAGLALRDRLGFYTAEDLIEEIGRQR